MCSVSDYYIEPKSTPLLEGLATVPKLTELSASNHSRILDMPPWIPPKSKPTTLSKSATFLPLTKPSKFDAVIVPPFVKF